MNIDISKIEFDARVEDDLGNNIAYFIAPKELLGDKYPEAEHSTISIKWNECGKDMSEYTVMISPTKDGEDYDWMPFDLDVNDSELLLIQTIKASCDPVSNVNNILVNISEAYKILVDEIEHASNSPDYIISSVAIEEAIEYLGEVLK